MSSLSCNRVGYWWSEKKSRKLNVKELSDVFRESGLELVRIDLDQPIDDQGPFAAFIHKFSDIIVKAKSGDMKSKAFCESFQKYVDSHPNIVIIDPLPNIDKILDRNSQYKIVDESKICKEGDIFIPSFVELTTMNVSENVIKMKSANVDFPVVCKPTMAHGSTRSHQMSLIFNEDGLNDIVTPCVVQKFINHNAVLYKLFIIGNEYFISERPSLKNFFAGDQKTIFFDSNDISKPHSASSLTELDDNEPYTPTIWPEKEKMDLIVETFKNRVGLNLFGIDVVVDNGTGHYAIVDINVFPGYYEAGNFYTLLTNLVWSKIHEKESGLPEKLEKPILIDYLSTPTLRMKEGGQFSFESRNIIQYGGVKSSQTPGKCFCCPISGASCNKFFYAMDQQATSCMSKNAESEQSLKMDDTVLSFQKQNGTQEDSGIETSDSCDEKKRKSCHRTAKHQHSKVVMSGCLSNEGPR